MKGYEENSSLPMNISDDVFISTIAWVNSLLRISRKEGLAAVIHACSRCKDFFTVMKPQTGRDISYMLFLYYIRLAFLCLAPPVLECGEECRAAMSSAPDFSRNCIKDSITAEAFSKVILGKLNSYGDR